MYLRRRLRPFSLPPPLPSPRVSRFFCSASLPNSSQAPLRTPPRKAKQAVRRFLKLLSVSQKEAPVVAALETLQNSPQNLSSSEAALLVSTIKDPLLAFDFYRFFRTQTNFKPEPVLYSSLIESQLNSINPKSYKIQFYLDEMKKHNINLTHIAFSRAIDSKINLAEFFVHNVMGKLDVVDRLEAYKWVISVYTKNGVFDKALRVAESARLDIRNLDCGFYCCVMDVHRAGGNAKEVMKTFYEMEDKGILPNGEAYNVLLGVLCSSGLVRRAWAILEEMKKIELKPPDPLARDLMMGFLKEDMVSEAEYFLKEGIFRDHEGITVFVETIVERRMPLRAVELLRTLRGSGLEVRDCVYIAAIRSCGKLGFVEEAEKIFDDVKSCKEASIGALMYLSMLYVYSKAEIRRSAEIIWEEMKVRGFGGHFEAYLYMMTLYGTLGLVEDVVKIFDLWKKSGCCLNVHAYSVLIDVLSKSGKMDQAWDSIVEMRSYKIHPSNSIYASIMDGYLRVGLLNHAFKCIDEYKISGLKGDGVIASSIAMVLIQADRYSELEFYMDGFARQNVKLPRDKGAVIMELCRDGSCSAKLVKLIE